MISKLEQDTWLRRLTFPQEIERVFQEDYYSRLYKPLRAALALLAVISAFWTVLYVSDTGTSAYFFLVAANLLVLRTAFWRRFKEFWQPLLVANLLAMIVAVFTVSTQDIPLLWIINFLMLLSCRVLRLQFRWMLLLQMAVLVTGSGAMVIGRPQPLADVVAFVVGSAIVSTLPLLLTFNRERFERGQFLTTYLLVEERNNERRKREQTESMLHVLSQAIGSIVHDLGNPLTSVQTGAQTLLYFVADEKNDSSAAPVKESPVDKAEIREFAEIILDGAEMLNYLRLSLIEQTRVLEGKPIPVEPKTVSIRRIMEAGARYQKPKFTSGRQVSLVGDDVEICVDEMKLITVFMNLIGNALKYSDGGVRVAWHIDGQTLLVAVSDEGRVGKGLSRAEAEQLFVPFGRLDAHAQIEGTGLGLLSVQKIIEAHGGEIYIEGYTNGTPDSAPFSTVQSAATLANSSTQKNVLIDGFRTAFVVACPLNSKQQLSSAHPGVLPGEALSQQPMLSGPMLSEPILHPATDSVPIAQHEATMKVEEQNEVRRQQ